MLVAQVLDIVYFSNTTTPGGFFPNGVTGMSSSSKAPFQLAAAFLIAPLRMLVLSLTDSLIYSLTDSPFYAPPPCPLSHV